MRSTKTYRILLIVAIVFLLVSCIPGDGRSTPDRPANFLWGIWHGWIAPISLVISVFNPARSIYEVHNTGFWYDLGFYSAVIAGFGGISLSRKKGRRGSGKNRRDYYDEG